MLISMTGYGQSFLEKDGVSYSVELRTVNSKYLKANLRLPENCGFLEDEIEKVLKKELSRGTVNYSLRIKNVSSDPVFEINAAYLNAYVEKLGQAAKVLDVESNVNLVDILSLPGVMQASEPDEEASQRMREVVLQVTQMALESLVEMRTIEGKAMGEDLVGHCNSMRNTLEGIRDKAPAVVREYNEKLKKRVDDLLNDAQLDLDQQSLIREVAIFADRCDISEEIARLDSHLDQFLSICQGDGASGKRLDFLCQEMFRETNTIGSKACDAELAKWVVDLKCCIDRIKEQVQNVE